METVLNTLDDRETELLNAIRYTDESIRYLEVEIQEKQNLVESLKESNHRRRGEVRDLQVAMSKLVDL